MSTNNATESINVQLAQSSIDGANEEILVIIDTTLLKQ
jgi:hypothetical protein